MEITITYSRSETLKSVLRRYGWPNIDDATRELVKWMFFRQHCLYLINPYKYIRDLNKNNLFKITSEEKGYEPVGYNVPDEFYCLIKEELNKACDRWGTDIGKVRELQTEQNISKDIFWGKMLSQELKRLEKKGKRIYTSLDYKKMKKGRSNSTINKLQAHIDLANYPELSKAIKKFGLNPRYMLQYFLLSLKLPDSIDENKKMEIAYLEERVDTECFDLEKIIKEGNKKIAQRDTLDFFGYEDDEKDKKNKKNKKEYADDTAIHAFLLHEQLERLQNPQKYKEDEIFIMDVKPEEIRTAAKKIQKEFTKIEIPK